MVDGSPLPIDFRCQAASLLACFPAAASALEVHLLGPVEAPASWLVRLLMKLFTVVSTSGAVAAGLMQPPAAVALAKEVPNFVSAFVSQSMSFDESFLAITFDSHLAFAAAFLPAAGNSFAVHLLGPVLGTVVLVVVVELVAVVVVAQTPLLVGVRARREKSVLSLPLSAVRCRLMVPFPAASSDAAASPVCRVPV